MKPTSVAIVLCGLMVNLTLAGPEQASKSAASGEEQIPTASTGAPAMDPDDIKSSITSGSTEAPKNEDPAPDPRMEALFAALKSAQPEGDDNTRFRVDFGSGDFMHQGAGPQGSKLSEKEKFMARMNAARAPKQKSWDDDYETICSSSAYIEAESMPFDPENPDPGWAWAAERLDACQHGPYPGGFSADEEGWRILRVDFETLPEPVRKYFEAHRKNGKLCVIDGVALFPPGVVLEWLPLFASTGKECEGKLDNLLRYGKDVGGERVGGLLLGKTEIGNSVRFQVRADLMRRKREKDEL